MTLELDVTGRRILLRGCNDRTAALAVNLLSQGAVVGVDAGQLTTAVADLLARGLISQAEGANYGEFDLIIGVDTRATMNSVSRDVGKVTLVGGGPGNSGLITLAGWDALQRADVIVFDRLAPLSLLQDLPARLIDVGTMPLGQQTAQEAISELLDSEAGKGLCVVRLKGGDSFVFGRGSEEWQACTDAGVAVEVIPGVSSAIAAPELAGIPVTHRGLAQGFTVVSGHVPPGDPRCMLDWPALARAGTTLVVLMGVKNLGPIAAALIEHGMADTTPAAVVSDAGLLSQKIVKGPLADIAGAASLAGINPPAVTIIGDVAGLDLGSVQAT